MSDPRGWHPVPAPRALVELPHEGASARAHELAGAWTLALIRSRAPAEIEQLPLGELAGEAPGLIAQLIAAVRSDTELEVLRETPPDGGLSPAGRLCDLAGARDAAELVQSLELLRAILSEQLEGQLREPTPRQAADLCQRAAHVCAQALAGGIGARAPIAPGTATQVASADTSSAGTATQVASADRPSARAAPAEAHTIPGRREDPPPHAPAALIVDELEGVAGADVAGGAAPGGEPSSSREERDAGPATIEIHDQRGEQRAVAWIAALAHQLERYEADRLPFAVLLVELREIERLRLETSPAELAALGASVEQALLAKLPGAPVSRPEPPWTGSLTPQRPGRYWLLAPETDRLGAHSLADRLTRAVASLQHRGTALEALAGIAVCPQDGRQAAALAAHADIDLHAARAARR